MKNIYLGFSIILSGLVDSGAAVTITGIESSSGVTFNATGSLNLNGALFRASVDGWTTGVRGAPSFLTIGQSGSIKLYAINSGPSTIGPGPDYSSFTYASSTSGGPVIGINTHPGLATVFVPADYVSGEPLTAGSTTFSGASFNSLKLIPGSYTWTLPNDSIVLNLVSVPEPSVPAIASLVALLSLLRFRGNEGRS